MAASTAHVHTYGTSIATRWMAKNRSTAVLADVAPIAAFLSTLRVMASDCSPRWSTWRHRRANSASPSIQAGNEPPPRSPETEKRSWRKPDRVRLLPLEPEDLWIELRARKKGQNDSPDAGQKLDPRLVGPEHGRADDGTDNQLSNRTNDDFRQCGRDPEPNRKQARDKRETQPQRRQCPYAGHDPSCCCWRDVSPVERAD